jgi:hypothetical protein
MIMMILLTPSLAYAASSADVQVYAAPEVLCITNIPVNWTLGTVDASSVTWAIGAEPSWPLADGNCTFTITNCGFVPIDVDITGANLVGASGTWTLAAAIGENIYALKAGVSGTANLGAMLQVGAAGQEMVSNLDFNVGNNTKGWEMAFYAPSQYTFSGNVTGTLLLTAREP